MKYVIAVLIALSFFATPAKADHCQDVLTEFLSLLAQDKKDELLKLVVPGSRLHTSLKNNENSSYTLLARDRFSQYQMLYNNAFAISPTADMKSESKCYLN